MATPKIKINLKIYLFQTLPLARHLKQAVCWEIIRPYGVNGFLRLHMLTGIRRKIEIVR